MRIYVIACNEPPSAHKAGKLEMGKEEAWVDIARELTVAIRTLLRY